jgi:cellobiose phosphorylase
MFTPQQASAHYKIVKERLLFPDGVRLVDRPIPYKGGVEVYFKRAESASNFGREIGMQYVHAHIRYIEAMCMLGQADEAYKGLLTICPIALKEVFKTSMPRQNNSYFSSSDANFADRYQAVKHFDDIKKFKVGIKGGWRVYSSGPGIYINQLLTNFLGIRRMFNDILIDPVLPKKLDGLTFAVKENGKNVVYKYHITKNTSSPYRISINGKEVTNLRRGENPYRAGGVLIDNKTFSAMLNRAENIVEIYI